MKFSIIAACCLLWVFSSQAQSQVSSPKYVMPTGAAVVVDRPAFLEITSLPHATTAASVIVQRPVQSTMAVYPPISRPAPTTTVLAPPTVFLPPRPVTVYSAPIGSGAIIATPTVAVRPGRPIIVRTKVYIPGQPIRNLLRAISP